MIEEILVGDVITTRKSHPCGSSEWTVIRTGADIKIRCEGCGREVMLPRKKAEKAVKKWIPAGADPGEREGG